MERLKQRLGLTKQALNALEEVLQMPMNKVVRDAAIQRFEFTVEATWKLAQLYLREQEGFDLNSPKTVFRGCFQVGLCNEKQIHLGLQMIDDRNLTVHTYNEALAQRIFANLPQYCQLMKEISVAIDNKIK